MEAGNGDDRLRLQLDRAMWMVAAAEKQVIIDQLQAQIDAPPENGRARKTTTAKK